MKEITDEKLRKYFSVTRKALDVLKISAPKKTPLNDIAKDFLEMAVNYFKDAAHFKEKGEYVNAFAALNYAHGWLDAGARLGLFDVNHDNKLFTVD
ncbi:DUF357 domain-containing protein [Candidatus Woesearchaeota archaeon]|nr:DUF357 domain-containing protein [Candidatus Woesearchaeota archaeon]